MSSQDDDSEKTFDATPQKLLEARKKGEIAKSTDLMTAAAYGGLFCALAYIGNSSLSEAGTNLMVLLDQAAALSEQFRNDAGAALLGQIILQVSLALSPVFLFPAIAVIAAIAAQRAFVVAPDKLKPKASRISVITNAKNKFGRSGIFEFAKSFTKLCFYSICLALFIQARMADMIISIRSSPQIALQLLAELCVSFLFVVLLISGGIGVIDAIWQHFEHLRKNKMSRKEIIDETKNAEGDPHLKQERRQRAMSIARNQMLADVPKADVVIVNPTHFAVALKWSRKPGEAPVCVAKGVDEIAKAIRDTASRASVPLHSDPPTARALFATTDIGAQISPDHFKAVAASIRFAETMRQKAKAKI